MGIFVSCFKIIKIYVKSIYFLTKTIIGFKGFLSYLNPKFIF